MSFLKICSAAMVLLLVMDPIGNLPLFTSLLKDVEPKRWSHIILRESVFALIILLIFLIGGNYLLDFMQISELSVVLAGGIILFLIALKMVFGTPIMHDEGRKNFFLVPLAIPLIAGPSAIAMVILMHSSMPLLQGCLVLVIAWIFSTLILLLGRFIAGWLGRDVLNAVESLMGFILAMASVEMLIKGVTMLLRTSHGA